MGKIRITQDWYQNRIPQEGEPVAIFSASTTTGSEPLDVDFTDASTGEPYVFSWELSTDSGTSWTVFSTVQTASQTLDAGTYSVKLTVTDEFSRSSTETKIDLIEVEE